MLKPAICYKEQLEKALERYFYSKEMMYFQGLYNMNYLLSIDSKCEGGRKQFAVVSDIDDNKLIGYIDYTEDLYSSCVRSFGAWGFENNPTMGKDLYELLETLVKKYHRVEFRAVSGNPAIRGYDAFLKKHEDIGKKHILTDVFKDEDGIYHDNYIYEFVK